MIHIAFPSTKGVRRWMPAALTTLLLALVLSACGGNPQSQQQSTTNKASLDAALAHAKDIGVQDTTLQPILRQEAQIGATNAPVTMFNDQPVTDYYTNISQRYHMLAIQVNGLITQATQQDDYQSTLDLQAFEKVLAQRQGQGFIEAKVFADQLTQDQKLQTKAQYPKDYLAISASAKSSTEALRLMGPAFDKLTTLQNTIKQLQSSHLDVTALNQEYQLDIQQFRTATDPGGFTQIIDQLNAQLQETTTFSTQAIPYVGAAKLKQLSSNIDQMKQYGQDVSSYQKMLTTDQTALSTAKSLSDYLKVSAQIDTDVASIQTPMIKGQATYLLNQFHQEVTVWGNAHLYHNAFDNKNYTQDYEYDQAEGFGSDADVAVQSAQTPDDYQAAIDLINNDMMHLKAMEADFVDTTPWSQSHATDVQLMQHYGVTTGQTVVISLIEQTLRVYQDGKFVQAYQITSGQFDKPSPPGFWHIFDRESPTKFKSSEPKGSAFWYPDTKINFAMEYRDGGYFLHDSWWRVNYGVGTNYPHYDTGGDESFAGTGSHGCINMREDQIAWLYAHSGYGMAVIIY
jgi:lipoprotein-anchoring transpeptidase ErfK/SrfK